MTIVSMVYKFTIEYQAQTVVCFKDWLLNKTTFLFGEQTVDVAGCIRLVIAHHKLIWMEKAFADDNVVANNKTL